MPEISIIVPVYNVEKYLKNCIDSILNQTFKDFELILVNDGSTDKSLDICKYYESIDSRIRIINKQNGGLSSARNAGLDVFIGKYVGFIDSDDYIHPQMYEILYNQMTKNNADIGICDFEKVYDFNKEFLDNKFILNNEIESMNNEDALLKLLGEKAVKYIIMCNKLYKKEIFQNERFKEGIIHEDEHIIHRLLYKAKNIIYIEKKLYFYLQREGSIMNKKLSIDTVDYLLACSDRIRFFSEKNLKDLKLKWEAFYLWKFFKEYIELYKNFHYDKKMRLLRNDFRKLLKLLLKSENHLMKEKISWIVFAVSPNIYYKLIK